MITSHAAQEVVVTCDADAPEKEGAKRWWVLAVLGMAQLMVVLDTTVVNIALPSAQRHPARCPVASRTDIVAEQHSYGWWGSGGGTAPRGFAGLVNENAAMPSLHVGRASG